MNGVRGNHNRVRNEFATERYDKLSNKEREGLENTHTYIHTYTLKNTFTMIERLSVSMDNVLLMLLVGP